MELKENKRIDDLSDYEELVDGICSNFDGIINESVVKKIKSGKYYAPYTAWNWYGKVYFENSVFICLVYKFGRCISKIEAETMEALRDDVSEKYGWE